MIALKSLIIIFLIFYYKKQKSNGVTKQIINKKINIKDLNYLRNLKKVIYTALLGKYDNVPIIKKEIGYDYFMFTDNGFDNKSILNWTILPVDENFKKSNMSIIKKQRFFKTHPHLFFKNYDLSIYIDSTFEIKGNLDEFLLRILTPNISIYVLEHPDRNSINNEFEAVIFSQRETKEKVVLINNKYKNEKFPDNNGLSENCLIVRKHNELNCIKFMEQWFEEINQNSHRDQLSFNYILWKNNNFNVKYISKTFIFEYFYQNLFHLKYFFFKNN